MNIYIRDYFILYVMRILASQTFYFLLNIHFIKFHGFFTEYLSSQEVN